MAVKIKGEYPLEVRPMLVEDLILTAPRVHARRMQEHDPELIRVWGLLYHAIRSVQAMEDLRKKEK